MTLDELTTKAVDELLDAIQTIKVLKNEIITLTEQNKQKDELIEKLKSGVEDVDKS